MADIPRFSKVPLWRCVDRSVDANLSQGMHKFVMFDEAATTPARVVWMPDAGEEELLFNRAAAHSPTVGPLGIYSFRRVELMGLAFLFKGGRLIDEADLIPSYVRHDIDTGRQWDIKPELPQRVVDGLVVAAVSNAYLIYGHWLLDILPRIWLAQMFFGKLSFARLIVPRGTPEFALSIIRRFFGVDAIVWHELNNENLLVENCILPSFLHNDHYFHSAMNEFVSSMIGHALVVSQLANTPSSSNLLYVTRRNFREASRSYRRTVTNESDVIALVTGFGFRVVAPEEMSWEEQIAVFSKANVIVGESGSGLHNSIFSKEGAVVVCLDPVNQVQASIAALRNQVLINQCSSKVDGADGRLHHVDIDRLRRSITAALEAAPHA